MQNKFEPHEAPLKEISDIIHRYAEERKKGSDELYGRYYAFDPVHSGHWIACDNSSGECFVEEFSSQEGAVAYLEGYGLEEDFEWTKNGYELLPEGQRKDALNEDEGDWER